MCVGGGGEILFIISKNLEIERKNNQHTDAIHLDHGVGGGGGGMSLAHFI